MSKSIFRSNKSGPTLDKPLSGLGYLHALIISHAVNPAAGPQTAGSALEPCPRAALSWIQLFCLKETAFQHPPPFIFGLFSPFPTRWRLHDRRGPARQRRASLPGLLRQGLINGIFFFFSPKSQAAAKAITCREPISSGKPFSGSAVLTVFSHQLPQGMLPDPRGDTRSTQKLNLGSPGCV